MFAQTPKAGAALLVALLISFGAVAAPAAAEAQRVPDLLELPARADARAQRTLQLALARAGDRLVSVGERGTVLLSDDNGRKWRQARQVPVSVALTDVAFVSATHGWAVGHSGVVLHSADGGETWVRQLDGNQAAQLTLEEAQRRLAAGEAGADKAVRTASLLVEDGPDKPFLSVTFADDQHGWIVGAYGLAMRTSDGGQHWQAMEWRIPNPRGKHLYRIRQEGGALVISGEQGALFRSTDGGEHFEEVRTPYAGTFFGAVAVDGALLAYGLRGNAWRSADGVGEQGSAWQAVDLGQPVTVTAGLRLADGAVVLADESGRLLLSRDGARSFAPLPGAAAVAGLSGLVQAADGALILSGTRGPIRVEARPAVTEDKK